MVPVDEHGAGLDNVFCLGIKQADSLYIGFQSSYPERMNCRGGVGDLVEFISRLIDADIGSLCRQDDRD